MSAKKALDSEKNRSLENTPLSYKQPLSPHKRTMVSNYCDSIKV